MLASLCPVSHKTSPPEASFVRVHETAKLQAGKSACRLDDDLEKPSLQFLFESPLDCKEIKPVRPKGNQT